MPSRAGNNGWQRSCEPTLSPRSQVGVLEHLCHSFTSSPPVYPQLSSCAALTMIWIQQDRTASRVHASFLFNKQLLKLTCKHYMNIFTLLESNPCRLGLCNSSKFVVRSNTRYAKPYSASLVCHACASSLIFTRHNQRLFITAEQIRQDYELCLIVMPSPPKVLGFSYLHNILSNFVKLATTLPHPHLFLSWHVL